MTSRQQMKWLTAALRLVLVVSALGCVVRGGYGPTYYDNQRCQWQWVADGYGGYHQLHCYSPYYTGYRPYMVGPSYVRAYPHWYVGPRVNAAPAPTTFVAPPVPRAMPAPMPQARPVGPGPAVGIPVR